MLWSTSLIEPYFMSSVITYILLLCFEMPRKRTILGCRSFTSTASSFRKDLSRFWASFSSSAFSKGEEYYRLRLSSLIGVFAASSWTMNDSLSSISSSVGKLYSLIATFVLSQVPLYTLLNEPVPIFSLISISSNGIH